MCLDLKREYCQFSLEPFMRRRKAPQIQINQIWGILPNQTQGHLFVLNRSAASKLISVRPVGDPEDTLKKRKILTWIIFCVAPPRPIRDFHKEKEGGAWLLLVSSGWTPWILKCPRFLRTIAQIILVWFARESVERMTHVSSRLLDLSCNSDSFSK